MLTAIQLGNFKSWREVTVPLAPITGFFGTNSSGKSSLLQALLLMKQTVESSDQKQVLDFGSEKTLVNLRSFQAVIFQQQHQNLLKLSISTNADPFSFLKFTCEIKLKDNQIALESLLYELPNVALGIPNSEKSTEALNQTHSMTAQKFYRFSNSVELQEDDQMFSILEQTFEQLLEAMVYLGPLRDFPKHTYYWSGAAPSNVGISGENTIAVLLAARVGGNKVGEVPLENYIAEKLRDLGLIESFRLEELREGTNIFRVLVRRTPESPEVSLTDVGFGVSQVLPVLVLCYYVPEGSTILLEQPELHLHPSVQSGLADVFIDAYKTRGVQIILESHSEHLLRRLQRRIAEENILTSDVNLYFCRLEHGESKLESLELDEYGQIHNYPTDFFGDRFEEISAMSEAAMTRRNKKVLEPA